VAFAAEKIDAKARNQRLPEPQAQDEVGRLVLVLNNAFDRLERSFEQATRFSSDASHELKTPLTIMRGEIEFALRNEVCNPRIESILVGLLTETQRLSDVTEKLLLLSSLSISLTKSDGLAVFRIANTGPGITKEHANRVFERFYRADPSRSSETSGSGLGLSICREIVMAHGGQLWLEQPRPTWTAFVVSLPHPTSCHCLGRIPSHRCPAWR
jgi:signal transduction histidine kinase